MVAPLGDKARLELQKDAILNKSLKKTAGVWLLTSHLTNRPSKTNKTYWALLEL